MCPQCGAVIVTRGGVSAVRGSNCANALSGPALPPLLHQTPRYTTQHCSPHYTTMYRMSSVPWSDGTSPAPGPCTTGHRLYTPYTTLHYVNYATLHYVNFTTLHYVNYTTLHSVHFTTLHSVNYITLPTRCNTPLRLRDLTPSPNLHPL